MTTIKTFQRLYSVVVLEGMRDVGKTTLSKELVAKKIYSEYRSFQDTSEREAAKASPDDYINSLPFGTIIDEAQLVEAITLPIKNLVDNDPRPGRFLLTGSERLTRREMGGTDPLVGRTSPILRLNPLTLSELARQPGGIVTSLFEENPVALPCTPWTKADLIKQLQVGGLPRLHATPAGENVNPQWFESYVRGVLTLPSFKSRDLAGLESTFRFISGQTSKLVNLQKFSAKVLRDARTIDDYLCRFSEAFLLQKLPGWRGEAFKSETLSPKLHIADTGIAISIGGLDIENQPEHLGSVLETFVANELYAQAQWDQNNVKLFHWRDSNRSEVDILLARQSKIICIEIKSGKNVSIDSFKGIKKFAKRYPTKFQRGFVFYTGDTVLPFGDSLWAIPLAVLRG